MKIELIHRHKVKVDLSLSDLLYFNIKIENLKENSPQLNKFLLHIMENVKQETSFNPYTGQVVIEAMHSKNGITLIISKITVSNEFTKEQKDKIRKAKAILKPKKLIRNIYIFDDFEMLLKAMEKLNEDIVIKSSLYKYKDKYYFITNTKNSFQTHHCILIEFCEKYSMNICQEDFLKEHGELIAAEENLLDMTIGIKALKKINN